MLVVSVQAHLFMENVTTTEEQLKAMSPEELEEYIRKMKQHLEDWKKLWRPLNNGRRKLLERYKQWCAYEESVMRSTSIIKDEE